MSILNKAARRGYENACDYSEVLNKTILIQQRALACLSKSLAHILQRELYTMGNTGLLRRKAEMTIFQSHLGDTRCQELRNSPFWPSSWFKSQLVKEGEDFALQKGYGGNSSQSSNQSCSSVRGKLNNRGSRPHSRGRGCGNPYPK